MIQTKDDLKYYIRCDAVARGETKSHLWKFQVLYRKAEYHYNNRHKLWHKLAYVFTYARFKHRRDKLCSELPLNVFAEGLVIWHGQNIIVNHDAKVGRNFSISSGCCIGSVGDGVPVIGNNVEMTIGSKVLGGISIADDVTIGAGAVVVKSIDTPHTTWGGVPAKCISTKENAYVAEKKARLESVYKSSVLNAE